MYLSPQMDVSFTRARRLACPVAELRRLAGQERVWRAALPWLVLERFEADTTGRLRAEGVVLRGPLRLRLRLDGRLAEDGESLALSLTGTLQHAVRLSAEAVATPEAGGSRLRCALRVAGLPQGLHFALAGVEHRAVEAAVSAVETFAARRRRAHHAGLVAA